MHGTNCLYNSNSKRNKNLHASHFSSKQLNNLTIFYQKYNQIEASCTKCQKCNEEYASLGEKGLTVTLEVAAHQPNTTERIKTQVTKDNFTIMARDKEYEGQKSSHLEYLGGQQDFFLHRKLCSLRLLTTLISYQYMNGLLNLEHICFS